mgnify:FL=1
MLMPAPPRFAKTLHIPIEDCKEAKFRSAKIADGMPSIANPHNDLRTSLGRRGLNCLARKQDGDVMRAVGRTCRWCSLVNQS